jgi:SAM-dependent methyltransferase
MPEKRAIEETKPRSEREARFHDTLAQTISISDCLIERFLREDSPATYLSDKLPRLRGNILRQIGDIRGKRVLVYGCGNDGAAVWFAKNGAAVDAIDVSEKSVINQQCIARKANVIVTAQVRDAHDTGLPSNEYDVIYGNAILHHLNIDRAQAEIYRLLKNEGLAIFREVMVGNMFLQIFRKITPSWRTPDEHPLTKEDLSMLGRNVSSVDISEYVLTLLPYLFIITIINNCLLSKIGIRKRIPISCSPWRFFDRIDLTLFRILPFLRHKAWLCLIVLRK